MAVFCGRNGSAMPNEEGFAKQTQVMLLGGLSADAVTAEAYPISIKLESLLRRYSWKKVPQIYSRIYSQIYSIYFPLVPFCFWKLLVVNLRSFNSVQLVV